MFKEFKNLFKTLFKKEKPMSEVQLEPVVLDPDYRAIAKALTKAKNLYENAQVRHVRGALFQTPTDEWPTDETRATTNGFCIRGALLWANGIHNEGNIPEGNIADTSTKFLSPIVREEFGYNGPTYGIPEWDSVYWNNVVAKDKNDLIKLLDLGIAKAERLAG